MVLSSWVVVRCSYAMKRILNLAGITLKESYRRND